MSNPSGLMSNCRKQFLNHFFSLVTDLFRLPTVLLCQLELVLFFVDNSLELLGSDVSCGTPLCQRWYTLTFASQEPGSLWHHC